MKHLFSLIILALLFGNIKANSQEVKLKSGSFIPTEIIGTSHLNQNNIVHSNRYCFIQFKKIPTTEQKAHYSRQGVELYNYVPDNTYMASFSTQTDLNKINDGNIKAVFDIAPVHKLDKFLAKKEYPDWAKKGNDKIELVVTHHPNLSHSEVAIWLTSRGALVEHSLPSIDAFRVIVAINKVEQLAELPYLYFIELFDSNPQPENYRGRVNHRSNMIATAYSSGLKYDGTGVNVALNDDGVIGPHDDYKGRLIDQYMTFNNGDHGDHCAGTIFGAGNLNPNGKGMATGARLGVYGVSGSFASIYQAFDSITNHYVSEGIRITSTSYSNGNNAGYTSLARMMDIQTNTMPELIHVFSAGNSGTSNFGYGAGAGWGNITGGHKQAKTAIATGNLNHKDVLANSSSRGPAHDGRIKPDICAVGTSVYSTVDVHSYSTKSGTSMACPGIAGVLAQLYHAYKDENSGDNPPSALMKAILLNTAEDLGNPGPDYKYGWGRVNAHRAYKVLKAKNYLTDSVSHFNNKNHNIVVPSGVAQVKVMVYWSDHEATANANKALVNNLDIKLVDQNTQTTLPWTLDPTPVIALLDKDAVRGVDTLNNMEQVTINNPTAGTYLLNIFGTAVPQGPQQYYVVYEFVTNDITVTYPSGGESFEPSSTETIRWDAYGNTGTFTLEYSLNNGGLWNTIATGVSGASRNYDWNIPNVTPTAGGLIRVSRNSISDQSDASFSIIGTSGNLGVNWVCIDSMEVTYNAVPGATGYTVSVLGDKYMEPVGSSNTTTCIVRNIDTRTAGRFMVQATFTGGAIGKPTLAASFPAAPFNCSAPEDIALTGFVTPAPNTIVQCAASPVTDMVSVVLRNNSFQTLTAGPTGPAISYSINGGAPVSVLFTGSLGVGYRDTITVGSIASFPTAGDYEIKAWLTYISPRNTISSTDTIIMKKTIVLSNPITSSIIVQDFESFTTCSSATDCGNTVCALSPGWTNESNAADGHDWRINAGPTPSRVDVGTTGPSQDFTPGSTTGKYAYLEATGCINKEALMITPCIDVQSVYYILSFAYHMYGADMGELHVDLLDNGTWIRDIAPPIKGDQGDNWLTQAVPLDQYVGKTVHIGFRGITGNGSLSDIAIDAVGVSEFGSVNDKSTGIAANIYPNPSDGIYNLTVNGADGDVAITITDINGRTLQHHTITARSKMVNTTIDMRSQTPSVYLMSIKTEKGLIYKKLVKM